MLRLAGAVLCCWVVLLGAPAAASDADLVTEYETKLESIASEIQQIREELEALAEELAEPEVGRVFVFLGSAPAPVREQGVTVQVDEKIVFSRPFTPAEQGVLDRGLPLELVELRLLPGEHGVAIRPLDGEPTLPATFSVERATLASWVAQISASGVTWRRE